MHVLIALLNSPYLVVWHVTTEIMFVIIFLLEDEQELSLGMLIRPKRIYNFCLVHACLVLLCHALDELSYTFDHIWTNLLTQCTPVPVSVFCCFSISGFPTIKIAPKIRENQIKNQRKRTFPNHLGGARGPPPGAQVPWWRALGLGRARGTPGPLVPPWLPPLPIYYPRRGNPEDRSLFPNLLSVPPPPPFQDQCCQE